MDAQGRLIDFNQEAATLFMLGRDRVGQPLGSLIVPPDLREGHRAGLERFLATGVSRIIGTRIEIDAIRTDGLRFPVELTIAMITDGTEPIFIAHIRDIQERKMAERRLLATAAVREALSGVKQPEHAIRDVLRALGESLQWSLVQYWTVSDDGRALRLGQRWADSQEYHAHKEVSETLTFARGEGLPGKTWQTGRGQWIENIPEQEWMPRVHVLKALGVNTGLAFPVVLGGEVIAVIEAFARERWPEQPELLAVLQALGGQLGHYIEEMHARAETERARDEAQEANRLKDEFLSVASHELRTPLNAVLGWAHLLRKGRLEGAAAERALEAIERNTLIQARLVGDLLDMSRIIAGKFQLEVATLDPIEPVRAALEIVRPSADAKQIRVSMRAATTSRIRGDAGRLQQVFWNVLANAVKFTPKHGSIDVGSTEDASGITITVTDTGVGIDREFAPRAFQRFAQADQLAGRGHGGLGLGLSIARQFVELHGGTISLQSAGKDKGTSVSVRLPLMQQEEISETPPLRQLTLAGIRVLVVSEGTRREDRHLADVLDEAGASVESASSPEEALGCLSRSPFDVVVADLRTAAKSLWLVMEIAAQTTPRRTTRSIAVIDAGTALDAGAARHFSGILTRPVDSLALVAAVQAARP